MTHDAPNDLVAGRYRLVRRLGTTGTDSVWEAWDERLSRPVALKMVTPQSGPTESHGVVVGRALQQGRLAAGLDHPNAVTVYDAIQHDGQPCLVMEYVPSRPLSDVLRERGPLDLPQAAALGAQVASALAAAHSAGIVHRTVTPASILVADDGTARISDLGIAPEGAANDESGSASDVFSLGETLYTIVEGAPPAEPVQPPQHAGGLTPLLLRMLAPDPVARPTMAEVADRLEKLAEDPDAPLPAEDEGPQAGPSTPARPQRGRLAVAVVALLVVAALVVTGGVLLRRQGDNEPAAGPQPAPSSTSSATTSSTTPPTSTSTGSATTTSPGAPDANQLAAAVTRYYSLLPGNVDEAFGLLTADYQTRVAGGRQAYQRFVDGYSAVTATDVTGSPPSTVTATVTYTTKSGQVSRERTTFGLVDDGGVLKISSSAVTSRS